MGLFSSFTRFHISHVSSTVNFVPSVDFTPHLSVRVKGISIKLNNKLKLSANISTEMKKKNSSKKISYIGLYLGLKGYIVDIRKHILMKLSGLWILNSLAIVFIIKVYKNREIFHVT